MKIDEVYKKYKIMPNLQTHMLRVAAVAWQISDNMTIDAEKDSIISACLLHDMGNIIKFKLDMFPEFLEPEGLDYWEDVKKEFVKKYGADEHEATYEIAKELGVSERTFEIINAIGFSKSLENETSSDFSKKIATYADFRVTPFGITSLENRMEEGRERFRKNKDIQRDEKYEKEFEQFANATRRIEQQIFEKCKIKPEEITDESIKDYLAKLDDSQIGRHKV